MIRTDDVQPERRDEALDIPVADAHCDFLYYAVNDKRTIAAPRGKQAVSIPQMRKGGGKLQFFAAWTDSEKVESETQQALMMIDVFHGMVEKHDELVEFDKSFDPKGDKIGCMLTMEGAGALGGHVENIRNFYRLGVRALTLTWNSSNEFAHPAMARVNRGLTRRGKLAIELMNEVGMAVDVAHLSDAGIDDVLDISSRPIFSSHTNSRTVCDHKRSLCDRHIRAIADTGGVVCVNYFPPQLAKTRRACIDDIVRHIIHVRNVGGSDAVALGSDFDGMNEYPEDLSSWADVGKLIKALRASGFSREELEKVAYLNLVRFARAYGR